MGGLCAYGGFFYAINDGKWGRTPIFHHLRIGGRQAPYGFLPTPIREPFSFIQDVNPKKTKEEPRPG